MLLLLGLVACSDYSLGGKDEHPKPQEDSDPIPVDTSVSDTEDSPAETGVVPTDDTAVEHPAGKIDVVLIMDVAYSYDCYRVELADRTSELINALFDSGADVGISIGTFDDYNVDGEWWVAYGGVPYKLEQQLTTDRATALASASRLEFTWGGDGPGTGYEAILQSMNGRGYDQDCNGGFDSSTDIKPFNANPSDAFGGGAAGYANSSVPGTGTQVGVGFRSGSKKVVVMFAENSMRDRAEGHETPTGACLGAASQSDAVDAMTNSDTKFLGVNAYEFWDIDAVPQQQLESLANRTSSHIDVDGDGAKDDIAVFGGDWDWPTTAKLVSAIWDLAE